MFNDAIWEHIDRFTKAKKTSDIQQQLERFSHQMGFDYFRLLIIFPISMQKSHVALFNNCPTSWFDAYSERHYLTQDPVVFLGLKQTQPIFWNKLDCDSPWLPSASYIFNSALQLIKSRPDLMKYLTELSDREDRKSVV